MSGRGGCVVGKTCAVEKMSKTDEAYNMPSILHNGEVWIRKVDHDELETRARTNQDRITREEVQKDLHDILWNADGSLVSHDVSYIVSSVMHYFITNPKEK